MVHAKLIKPKPILIGSEEFLIASHGTSSGYPFIIENDAFMIQFGEFNRPNFFVKFRSIALWHYGALALHNRFLAWSKSIGMMPYQPGRSSRVDYALNYHLPVIDFDLDSFITVAAKVNQHRKNGKVQTFDIGFDIIKLRVYDKVDEINKKK